MSEFKVGDLVECINDSQVHLTIGKNYHINSCGDSEICVKNDIGEPVFYNETRFKLVEPKIKVGDKVKHPNASMNGKVCEIVGNIAFIDFNEVYCKYIQPFKLSDLEKVEEKTAPPKKDTIIKDKLTGRLYYSLGSICSDGFLMVSHCPKEKTFDALISDWEVIG